MKTIKFSLALAAMVFLSPLPAQADHQDIDQDEVKYKTINLAGYPVPVIKDGLYDRFRSNPPLSVIAEESPSTDLSWFETLTKTKLDVGFETWSPNFYYENSKVTVIYTADLYELRNQIPRDVREYVQPLEIFPGRGLVALTGYAYHYCDNDYYNEISVSIVTNRAGKPNHGLFSLLAQLSNNDFWGYVTKLPLDSELGRVRGVVGYNLPKWTTRIDYEEKADSVVYRIYDEETGQVDFTLETAVLDDLGTSPTFVANNFVNLDHDGNVQFGYSTNRQLKSASSMSSGDVSLTLTDGSLSRYLKSLDLGMMFRYEYTPDFQSALYAPQPISALNQ